MSVVLAMVVAGVVVALVVHANRVRRRPALTVQDVLRKQIIRRP